MRNKRHAFAVCFLILLLIPVVGLFAQSQDWYYDKPIKSVTFTGLHSMKASDLEGVTSGFIGKKFNDEVFADLLNRVYSLDYFDDIAPQALPGNADKSSVTIILTVSEKPIITKISFIGNKQIRSPELKETVSIKEKDIFVHGKMLIDERTIRDLYLGRGFTNIKVSSKTEEKFGGIEITFNINEGQPTIVSTVNFKGNNVVASKTLKGKISLKEASLFNKGAFQESMIESDKQAIIAYYQNRGYVDISVTDVMKEVNFNSEKNRDELNITFVIQEGSQYTFGGITFKGNKVFNTELLNERMKLKSGSLFNQAKFQESLVAVTDLYYENGYTSNQFTPFVNKDNDTKVISYTIEILENPRSHIENIVIKGNTRTQENVIRREITLQEGDIFSKGKLTSSMRNLYNLQYFSAVVPDFLPGSEENLVDLVFSVEEQSTTSLEFGFTFSGVSNPDDLPISLYLKVQDSNLFGKGKSVSASTNLSTDNQSIGLSYGENWLFGLPISTSFSLDYSHSNNYALRNKYLSDGSINNDDYYMAYEQHSFSLSASLGHRWTPDFAILTLSGGINGSIVNNIYNDSIYTPVDYTISQYSNNWAPKNAISLSFSADGRDISYDASAGWFASQKLSWYGLLPKGVLAFAPEWGENEFYLRSDTKAEKYFTLINKPITESWALKLVFMAYSGISFQFALPDYPVGDTNKLYIDGMFNGRGWSNYNIVKGKAMWSNILELRSPIVPGIISLDFFCDAINIKDNAYSFFTDLNNKDDWYFSFGPGFRFTLAQFPLRFMFASTFKYDEAGNLKWTDKYGTPSTDFWTVCHFVLSFNVANR